MIRRDFIKSFSIFAAGIVALPSTVSNIVSQEPAIVFTTATHLTMADLVKYINETKEWKSYMVGDVNPNELVFNVKLVVLDEPSAIVEINDSGDLSFC